MQNFESHENLNDPKYRDTLENSIIFFVFNQKMSKEFKSQKALALNLFKKFYCELGFYLG